MRSGGAVRRRALLVGLALGGAVVGAVLALGGAVVGAVLALGLPRLPGSAAPGVISFYGEHQAGIATPPQGVVFVAAFDLTTTSLDDLRELLKRWTTVSARLTSGRNELSASHAPLSPPADTGETYGYAPSRLTMTFGAGPSLFDGRFGLARLRPAALVSLPPFLGDRLQPELSNGDLGVQICADDAQVSFHALRELVRAARGVAVLRWSQQGFQPTPEANTARQTARNLQGFKDGTGNVDTRDTG